MHEGEGRNEHWGDTVFLKLNGGRDTSRRKDKHQVDNDRKEGGNREIEDQKK